MKTSQKIISFLKFLKNNLDQEKLSKDEIFQIVEIVDSFKSKMGIKPATSDPDIPLKNGLINSTKSQNTNKVINVKKHSKKDSLLCGVKGGDHSEETLQIKDENVNPRLLTPAPPPPPPPPMPVKSAPVFNKCVPPKPSKRQLKRVRWKPLTYNDIKTSEDNIWKICQILNIVDIDTKLLESVFEAENRSKPIPNFNKHDIKKTTGIDDRKLFSINIVLKKIKRQPDEICTMISKLDGNSLNIDMLKQIENGLLNTKDEEKISGINDLTQYTNPAEKFLIQLIKIPNYRLIIRGLIFIEEFPLMHIFLKITLTKLIHTCDSILKSKSIKIFMKMILLCGNYLNHGTFMGNAFGLDLTNLHYATTATKGKSKNINLLIYILYFMKEKYAEEYGKLITEMKIIEECSKYDFIDITEEMSRLDKNYKTISESLPSCNQNIKSKFLDNFKEIEMRMKEIHKLMSIMSNKLEELGKYFCVDGPLFAKFEIIKLLSSFSPDISSMETIFKSNPPLFP